MMNINVPGMKKRNTKPQGKMMPRKPMGLALGKNKNTTVRPGVRTGPSVVPGRGKGLAPAAVGAVRGTKSKLPNKLGAGLKKGFGKAVGALAKITARGGKKPLNMKKNLKKRY